MFIPCVLMRSQACKRLKIQQKIYLQSLINIQRLLVIMNTKDMERSRWGVAPPLLAGLDLKDGHVFARVEDRHRSKEFIELLKDIDNYYPEGQIRLINDNHSSHISKETRDYLASRPNRFVYVHTPKHGSWLNMAETLFGKGVEQHPAGQNFLKKNQSKEQRRT